MIRAADILGVHPESVIRLALSEMYLDSGRSLERHITDGPYLRDAYLPDLRASERTNSVSVKRDRHALQKRLDKTTDPDHRASIQAKIDAIKV